ncbi:MAG: SGNH/GDSL hydrolase family protein [Intrasporangium sp.]|uniref:SGNH/GDSL hydrolase family protein n=1 Tax=Intrasporangium sp. TaxID=1925024 RepID=UPI00264779F8|nr:SGNH/GDSL hydrolase family protein [Intrasporangium sp.]MDN5797153.1 SGNH/GDSL hydrolase family protein [Intrasporangium sp.]
MGRARRARRIAQQAVYGGGGAAAALGALGLAGYGVLRIEAELAKRIVGSPFDGAPDDNGTYGYGPGDPIRFLMLGDSTAAGMGAATREQTVGAIIANGVAALSGRPVGLTDVAVVGAESRQLGDQVVRALEQVPHPDVAVISIGANDVTHRNDRSATVRHLEMAVSRLRLTGAEVVVATCPDLGAIEPLPQPLKLLARRWSRDLAAAQTVAVVEAGGRAVSVGNLLGPSFMHDPKIMFSEDRFHPSPAGYARLAAALLPSVVAALELLEEPSTTATSPHPHIRHGEGVGPLPVAATKAVRRPGTEVGPAEISGESRGPRGRWAVLLRRVLAPVPQLRGDPDAATEPGEPGPGPGEETPTDPPEDGKRPGPVSDPAALGGRPAS